MTDENDTPVVDDTPAIDPALLAEANAVLDDDDQVTPSGPDQVPADDKVPLAPMLQQLFDLTFNAILAPRRGDHWRMSGDELKTLSTAYAAVVEKYFPDLDFGVELTAIMVTTVVIGPRIARDQARREPAAPHDADELDDDYEVPAKKSGGYGTGA